MSYPPPGPPHSSRNGPAPPSIRRTSHSSGTPHIHYNNSLAPPPSDRRSSSTGSHAKEHDSRTPEGDCPNVTYMIELNGMDSRPMSGAGGPFSDLFAAYLNPGRNLSSIKVAIKVIKDSSGSQGTKHDKFVEKLQRRTKREAKLWYSLTSHDLTNHQEMFENNILPCYGLARLRHFNSEVPGFVMPFCENGTVLQYVERNPLVKRLPLIRGIAKGLAYIHGKNCVHGDIKSANILMSSDLVPLISDFGCAKIPDVRGYTTDFKYSARYHAPELAILTGSTGQHLDVPKHGTPSTQQSDVWAFGMVGAEVLGGSVVFSNIRELSIPSKVAEGVRPRMADFPNLGVKGPIADEAKIIWPILENCWIADPRERSTMDNIVICLA